MSAHLTLLCHAATSAVRRASFPLDEPIDPPAHAKASEMAADFRRVDCAWTSPALRARQTADAMHLDAVVEPALRDIDLGSWAGQAFADIDGAAIAAWTSDASAAPHGGESVVDLLGRMVPWLETLGEIDGRIVAVTHPAVVRAVIILALGAQPMAFWRIDVAPLCRARLRGNAGHWTLLSLG